MSVRVLYCVYLTLLRISKGSVLLLGGEVHSLSSFFFFPCLALPSFPFLPLSFTLIRTGDERRGEGPVCAPRPSLDPVWECDTIRCESGLFSFSAERGRRREGKGKGKGVRL